MSDTILYIYKGAPARELSDEEREQGIAEPVPAHHPGVPLRDLTAADVEAMPGWLVETIEASDLYEATTTGARRRNAIKREKVVEREAEAAPTPLAAPAPRAEKPSDS